MYYGGYEDFDGANGGVWKKYINIPIKTVPLEYAQYLIEIDDTNVSVYNAKGDLKAQASIASEFWSLVRSDGFDIRAFDHLFNQLWFWVEMFDYTNKKAKIWVRLPENSEELNIAFGNEKASESSYKDGENTFEFFDDFTSIDTNKWTIDGTASIINGTIIDVYRSGANVGARLTTVQSFSNKGLVFRAKYMQDGGGAGDWADSFGLGNAGRATNGWGVRRDSRDTDGYHYLFISGHKYTSYYLTIARGEWAIWSGYATANKIVLMKNDGEQKIEYSYSLADDTLTFTMHRHTYPSNTWARIRVDWFMVLKLVDPATFGTPRILEF